MTQQEMTQRLATLTAEPPRKTSDFFKASRALLQDVSDEIGIPIIFGSVTTLGRLVLPIWAAPREFVMPLLQPMGFKEAGETALNQLNDLVTFMLIQKYRTGSAEDVVENSAGDSERGWLFSEISRGKRGEFLRATRGDAQPRVLTDLTEAAKQEGIESCLRRSTYKCQWVDDPDDKKFDMDAYTPWFGEIPLGALENPMRRLLISPAFFQRHEATQHAAALYLFLPGEDESGEGQLIEKIRSFFPQLTMLAARVNEELRAQVTSAHPRYCSRYFQVVLGKTLFPLFQQARSGALDDTVLLTLVREAARSLFDNRVHPVATRRLVRELAVDERKTGEKNFAHEFFDPIVGSALVEAWQQRPDAPPAPAPDYVKGRLFGETRVVAAASPRGGVGKTLLAYNIARMLVEADNRVLLIELDAANPTVYFIDSDYRTKVHKLRDFASMRENRFDPVSGARGDAARAKCPSDGFLRWTCKLKSGLHILGALPGIRDMAEMLAADTLRRTDRSQMDALLAQIRSSKLYDWVIIDTPAGFRDLANAAILSSQLDLLLLCSFPTKPSLLSMLVGLEVLHANGVTAKQMLVLNECREMDVELFRDRASIADFAAYWMRNGGIAVDEAITDVGIINADKIVRQISNLPPVSAVSWDDFAARLETDLDYDDVGRHDFGLKQLVAGIVASTSNA